MRISELFGTRHRQRTSAADCASHDLLIRAGYIRQHAAGIYAYLTPGLRALRRIESIVRTEMEAAGAQEILMPVVHSADVWKATGRFASIDATLARLKDRRGHDMVLGMTHEEIVAQLAATEIRSYRDADVVVYQIQTKFRDEARPRAGLLRTREFIMKDAYSLHVHEAGLDRAYRSQLDAYGRIFQRAGLRDVHTVRSSTGDMGGSGAHEVVALLDVGEDTVGFCGGCGDAVNTELLDGGQRAAATPSRTAAAEGHNGSSGTTCERCGGEYERRRAVEVGNTFRLGRRYGEALRTRAVDADGQRHALLMGSYGIGVSRLLATLVEQHHDEHGIALPVAVAPFDAHIMIAGTAEPEAEAQACEAYEQSRRTGLDVLFDDRDVRAGEKFADADLIGAPLRVTFGARTAASGGVEVRERRTGVVHHVAAGDGIAAVSRLLRDLGQRGG